MGSSQTRDETHVSWIGRQILYQWAIREAKSSLLFTERWHLATVFFEDSKDIFPRISCTHDSLRILWQGSLFSVSKQMNLLGECSGSIDSVKRLEHKLTEEEDHFPGFVNLNSTETQTAGECVVLYSEQSEIEDLKTLWCLWVPLCCLPQSILFCPENFPSGYKDLWGQNKKVKSITVVFPHVPFILKHHLWITSQESSRYMPSALRALLQKETKNWKLSSPTLLLLLFNISVCIYFGCPRS